MSGQWLQGGDRTFYRCARMVRTGPTDDRDMTALRVGSAVKHLLRALVAEPPPGREQLEVAVEITVVVSRGHVKTHGNSNGARKG